MSGEHEAVARYRQRTRSAVMVGAFRKGYRARHSPNFGLASNPYRAHATGTGWGRRCWEAWVEGWNVADREYEALKARLEEALRG